MFADDFAIRNWLASLCRGCGFQPEPCAIGAGGRPSDGPHHWAAILGACGTGAEGVRALQWFTSVAPKTPIFLLTSETSTATGVQLLEAGADLWLPLQTDPNLMRSFLLAARRRFTQAGGLPAEAVHLDSGTRTLQIAGHTAKLRPTEFRLVEYLLARQPNWVCQTELRERVLTKGLGSSDSLVRVHMTQIRRALGPHHALLHSSRHLGYRLSLAESPVRPAPKPVPNET